MDSTAKSCILEELNLHEARMREHTANGDTGCMRNECYYISGMMVVLSMLGYMLKYTKENGLVSEYLDIVEDARK